MLDDPTSELKTLSTELRGLQTERLKRQRARSDLLTYASSIDIPGAPANTSIEEKEEFVPIRSAFGKHHVLWLKCLQDIEDGKIRRLMGLMPPGSAKSTYSSIVFPTHYLGRFPGRATIVASYGSDLPKKFGRRARSVVRQPIYKRIFNTELSQESQAVDEWTLTNGSEWIAMGIGAGITGNRVDGVIWDDLIKGREQADSKTIRDKTWDSYINDLMTRKKPGGWEVGITTRWHEDDPAGRILPLDYNGESGWIKGQDGNDWYVVCLPAEAEREDDILQRSIGDVLWPEWFSKEHFAPFKLNSRSWAALFQQRPAPETGNFFQVEWLRPYGEGTRLSLPHRDTLHIYGASDYATTDEGGNYTVHIVAGVDPEHNIYILDLWRERTSSDIWVESFCDLVKKWRPLGWAEETGQIKSGVGPFLNRRLMERHLYIARADFPARGSKETRAQSIRGRMAMGKVYFPISQPWFHELKRELLNFPAGKTDDQVDALGLLGQVLDKMISGHPLLPDPEKPKILSTDPNECTVTLTDLFEDNERRYDKIRHQRKVRIA
jgi:predicted phage terminase large subunit-like protein